MESRGKFPGYKLAVIAALAIFWAACAAGPGGPRTLPTPATASERVGPWDITIALFEPALYGPERSLADLVGEYRLHLEDGKLKGARLLAIKAQRRLELWVGRRMVKAYRVQLGIVPYGAKMRQGDRMTPEGDYFICAHKESTYYLALWISHPHLADARRGGLQVGDTDPATIKEFQDWTEGCIALFNPDIRELYELVPDGTPIRIVADGPITPPRPASRRKGQKPPGY